MTQIPETSHLTQIDEERVNNINAYWRACNYLNVGQIYLKENPLLREEFTRANVKPRLLGHFGTSPGLSMIYAHLNRLIQDTDSDFIYVAGPGHGGPALLANVWLEGTMTQFYPSLTRDQYGMFRLFKQFSWPGGVPSHVSPPTPGSIHEGGELGYSLSHAYGACFDNPNLIVACVVGDGEAETGPLATGWQGNKFVNAARDGAVLPILHLNGYRIAAATLMGRMSDDHLRKFFEGLGHQVVFVEGDQPDDVHRQMWHALDWAHGEIRAIQQKAREEGVKEPAAWPMIIMRTPKGWTGPKEVDGKKTEGCFRSHQVPLANLFEDDEHFRMLGEWLRSYKPEELFDEFGRPFDNLLSTVPRPEKRMGASPYANGGLLRKPLHLPNFREYAVDVPVPGDKEAEATRNFGHYLRDVFKYNDENKNFRGFCPDEWKSNRLESVFEFTPRCYLGEIREGDEDLGPEGRVLEQLSEHQCQGWLEGYLLTGRHGIFPCYEAFALIVDSMVNQHAKWMQACDNIPWRKPISSFNYLLSSHAWRQDHNGYSHQGPGFIQTILDKKSSVARIYLPPDANCLLSVMDHCLASTNYINLIIAGKQPSPQWLTMEQAVAHCARGAGVWDWASNDEGNPDVIIASAGDTPTLEALAAVTYLRCSIPELRVRFVNVVDLLTLITHRDHPHGFDDNSFAELFTEDKPVVFAFHGNPRDIHELVYRRPNPTRFHVRGYIQEGTTTTPFDMTVLNLISRFHLAVEALHRVPRFQSRAGAANRFLHHKIQEHKAYVDEHGEDMPEIRDWKWSTAINSCSMMV